MTAHSTARRSRRKRTDRLAPPYPQFPLQPHATGHWSKRIKGRLVYFGCWAGVYVFAGPNYDLAHNQRFQPAVSQHNNSTEPRPSPPETTRALADTLPRGTRSLQVNATLRFKVEHPTTVALDDSFIVRTECEIIDAAAGNRMS